MMAYDINKSLASGGKNKLGKGKVNYEDIQDDDTEAPQYAKMTDEEEQSLRKRTVCITCAIVMIVIALFVLLIVYANEGKLNHKKGEEVVKYQAGTNPYTLHKLNVSYNLFSANMFIDGSVEPMINTKGSQDVVLPSENNPWYEQPTVSARAIDFDTFNLKIFDSKVPRFEVPKSVYSGKDPLPTIGLSSFNYTINDSPFYFEMRDKVSGDMILSTQNRSCLLFDKYMKFGFNIPEAKVYGLGQRTHDMLLEEGNWTMWAHPADDPYDDGQGGFEENGQHPFVFFKTSSGWVGILLLNSNAQQVEIFTTESGQAVLNFITIGGILDMYFFHGSTPEEMIKSYHSFIGFPAFPPFWALGWQQSARSYNTQKILTEVFNNYTNGGFPLDGIWVDRSFQRAYENFNIDTESFPDLAGFSNLLRKNGKRMVIEVVQGVTLDQGSSLYKEIEALSAYVRSNFTGFALINEMINGTHAIFPDWFDPNMVSIWERAV